MAKGLRFSKIAQFRAVISILALMAWSLPALADDLVGIWQRETGASRVRFSKCGDAYCGVIVWLKDPNGPAKLGQRIFYDMKPSGTNAWKGQAFNPEDGKTYAGTMNLSGASLTTAGCVLGGWVCKSVSWSRAN